MPQRDFRINNYKISSLKCLLTLIDFEGEKILNYKDREDRDIYLLSAYYGHLEIMKYLEENYNQNVYVVDYMGNNSYINATLGNNVEIIQYLEKKHNFDFRYKNREDFNAYEIAKYSNDCGNYGDVLKYLENYEIRKIANALEHFEFKGIKKFYDISSILIKPTIFNLTNDLLKRKIKKYKITKILAIDARGFIFGSPLAIELGLPLVMVRKKGKMPEQNIIYSKPYTKEYNEVDVLCIPKNSVSKEDNVLIIDDLIATGGTLNSAIELAKMCEAKSIVCGSIVELKALNGRENLNKAGNDDVEIFGLIDEEFLK